MWLLMNHLSEYLFCCIFLYHFLYLYRHVCCNNIPDKLIENVVFCVFMSVIAMVSGNNCMIGNVFIFFGLIILKLLMHELMSFVKNYHLRLEI